MSDKLDLRPKKQRERRLVAQFDAGFHQREVSRQRKAVVPFRKVLGTQARLLDQCLPIRASRDGETQKCFSKAGCYRRFSHMSVLLQRAVMLLLLEVMPIGFGPGYFGGVLSYHKWLYCGEAEYCKVVSKRPLGTITRSMNQEGKAQGWEGRLAPAWI